MSLVVGFADFLKVLPVVFAAKGPDADPEYVYDERGLKVKSDKIAKVEQKAEAARKEVKSEFSCRAEI